MQVIKRNETKVKFDGNKIKNAVLKAAKAAGYDKNNYLSVMIADLVEQKVNDGDTVEQIQDQVESALIRYGASDVAKRYILYRNDHTKARMEKMKLLNTDTLDPIAERYTLNQLRVLESRYLLRDDEGNVIESVADLFERIAIMSYLPDIICDTGERRKRVIPILANITDTDIRIGKYRLNRYHKQAFQELYKRKIEWGQPVPEYVDLVSDINKGKIGDEKEITRIIDLMATGKFLPNSPTIMNAGARLGQLSACFVLPMEDNLKAIMKTVSDAALIFQSGGGVGINYSDLRPEGAIVASTSGVASGPISFMGLVNGVTEVVKQGGKRRGANMGILDITHPDIEKFIEMKQTPGVLENFNISVGIWGNFWEALEDGADVDLKHDCSLNERKVNVPALFDMIARSAWKSAEPGIIFLDNINKSTPATFHKVRGGPITSTNPCGEQSLYPYESCNLGSVNIAAFVDSDGEFDWDGFATAITMGIRFLDNVVDVNRYPIPEIDASSRETRRIGLGIMGLADAFFKMRIKYDGEEGYAMHERLGRFFAATAARASAELGLEKGAFPLLQQHGGFDWYDAHPERPSDVEGLRNVVATTIAPTGSIAMIAGCSNGVEPAYSLVYEKQVAIGTFYYTNGEFENALKAEGLYSDRMLKNIASMGGSVQGDYVMPKTITDVFVTAMDIHYHAHITVQAIWQKYIGNSISKTINMPESATVDDVKTAYKMAHNMGLKGITIYREGSRHKQVLHTGKQERKCSECNGSLEVGSGCVTCSECGISACAV